MIASRMASGSPHRSAHLIMRYVTFSSGGAAVPGVIEKDAVHPLVGPASLTGFIGLSRERRAAVEIGPGLALESVRLSAPVRPAKNVFCVGRNYLGHAEEIARAQNRPLDLPKVPAFFTKAPSAIADPGQTLHLSGAVSCEYDWEAELAVVIGERCKDVEQERALDVVFGYTCLCDVTARDIPDPQALDIALTINGVTKQSSNTQQMIFSVASIIAHLSRGMTLEPGDVIATGTPDGVGMARTPPEFLQDGDRIEVEIQQIGVLRNAVALTPPA